MSLKIQKENAREYIDENHIEAISNSTVRRINYLSQMAEARKTEGASTVVEAIDDDVTMYLIMIM